MRSEAAALPGRRSVQALRYVLDLQADPWLQTLQVLLVLLVLPVQPSIRRVRMEMRKPGVSE